MADEFFWPLLKPSELAHCLSQCNLNVTESDIKASKPNKEKLLEIYSMLCILISGDNLEDCDIPNPEALEVAGISKVNQYQEGICELGIYRAIIKLMKAAAIPNFSIQNDITEADGQRTIFNLSGLMNFAKFREKRLSFYAEITQESEELLAEKETKLEYQEQLKKHLRALELQAEENRPIIKDLTEQRTSLVHTMNEKDKQQKSLCEESSRIKNQNKDFEERIEGIGALIESTHTQISHLRSGIIEEPEQAVELIEVLREKIDREKEQKAKIERKNLQLRTTYEQLTKLQKELEKCIELLEKCKAERSASKKSNKENKNLQTSVNEVTQKYQDLERNMELHRKQQLLATQRLEASCVKYKKKIKALEKEKGELESSFAVYVRHANTELHQKIEQHRASTAELSKCVEVQTQEHNFFVSTLQQQLDLLYSELAGMHHQILDKIDQRVDM